MFMIKSEKGLIIFILLVLIGVFSFDYFYTKLRLEKIYKVENPSFIHVVLEMWR